MIIDVLVYVAAFAIATGLWYLIFVHDWSRSPASSASSDSFETTSARLARASSTPTREEYDYALRAKKIASAMRGTPTDPMLSDALNKVTSEILIEAERVILNYEAEQARQLEASLPWCPKCEVNKIDPNDYLCDQCRGV